MNAESMQKVCNEKYDYSLEDREIEFFYYLASWQVEQSIFHREPSVSLLPNSMLFAKRVHVM
jgi:hypothetical protein